MFGSYSWQQGYCDALMKLGALTARDALLVKNKVQAFAASNSALAAKRHAALAGRVSEGLANPGTHAFAKQTGLPARDIATLMGHGRLPSPPPVPVSARFAS